MRLFPVAGTRPTHSKAEQALYVALGLCSLPWTAFHSLRLRSKAGWEGEGDFVIANPSGGFLVLEVKGGRIELRDGQWYQNGRLLDRAPRDQGLSFAKKLASELRASGIEPPPFGVATAFPDCEFSVPPANGDLRGLVLGARDLPHLSTVLADFFALSVREAHVPTSRKWLQQLESWWGASWVPRVKLTDLAEDAARRDVALDAEQYKLLDQAEETPRALVEGPAGSGKTLVAMELCRRRARAGLRTTYLCFTDALAKAVNVQFQDAALPLPRPVATSVRQLAVDLLRGTGAAIPAADKAFWDEVSFNAAAEALPPEAERPQALVVDEGQDFQEGDWLLVEQLIGDRGLWVFRDLRQAYWEDRVILPSLLQTLHARFRLQRLYRCPPGLAEFAEAFATEATPGAKPPPEQVRLIPCPAADTVNKVRHLVDELRREGAKASDIAIVSLAGQKRSDFYRMDSLGTHRVVRADAPDTKEHVIADTFLRFKGLERPFVIVCEASGDRLTHFNTRMHIGLTRATVQALIIAAPELIAADSRLRLLSS